MPTHLDQYESERALRCQQGLTAMCLLAVLLLAAFALCDHILVPERAALLLRIRLGYVALLALVTPAMRGDFVRRHPCGTGLVLGVAIGAMVDVLVALTGGVRSPYYAGHSLLLTGLAVLLPWPPLWAFVSSGLIVAGYALTVWLTPPADAVMLATTLAFLGSTMVIAVVASAIGERLRRREFENRCALAEALEHKSEFLASVSHDLRTPLNVVVGYAQLLREETFGPLNPEQNDTLERIIRTSTMQMTLINDLLDLARIEQKKVSCERRRVALADLLPRLNDMMGALLHARPVRFETDVQADAVVWSDAERLSQILSNVLANAAKFTREGHVRLAAVRDGTSVRIDVADSGPGMSRELQTRALEPFARGESDAPGFGLGLAIVDRLLRLLGGTIEIDSRVGVGTTVVIRLPAVPTAGLPERAAS